LVRAHELAAPGEKGVAWRAEMRRRLRSSSLIGGRRIEWMLRPAHYPKPYVASESAFRHVLHDAEIPLRRPDPHADPVFEEGKRMNVSLAAPALDGIVLEAGVPFSFWRAVGQPRAGAGYRHGMELRGGCVVPSLGGGLCLLSNVLFRAAAELGWVILERHGHTLEAVPSNEEPWGVDATLAWPYIDLRFMLPLGDPNAQLVMKVRGDVLHVTVRSAAKVERKVQLLGVDDERRVVDGQRIRRNPIVRRVDRSPNEVIAVNSKRLLEAADLGRSCLTCGLEACAGRVTIR
jgi:vancomycin resistance protein VanW